MKEIIIDKIAYIPKEIAVKAILLVIGITQPDNTQLQQKIKEIFA